jgi:hypothetical protein
LAQAVEGVEVRELLIWMKEMICYFVGARFAAVVGVDVQYGLFVALEVDLLLEVMDQRIYFV